MFAARPWAIRLKVSGISSFLLGGSVLVLISAKSSKIRSDSELLAQFLFESRLCRILSTLSRKYMTSYELVVGSSSRFVIEISLCCRFGALLRRGVLILSFQVHRLAPKCLCGAKVLLFVCAGLVPCFCGAFCVWFLFASVSLRREACAD